MSGIEKNVRQFQDELILSIAIRPTRPLDECPRTVTRLHKNTVANGAWVRAQVGWVQGIPTCILPKNAVDGPLNGPVALAQVRKLCQLIRQLYLPTDIVQGQ